MITFDQVYKEYRIGSGPRARRITALHPISLHIRAGTIHGLIGQSGAGKSSLLRLINRLETPSGGHLLVDGEDVTTLDDPALRRFRQRVGMVFQHFNLLSTRTVLDNVTLPLELAGQSSTRARSRALSLLDRVGLAELAGRFPGQLSGGQKQRVGIARALAPAPRVLLCDEATSALDPQTTASILALLGDLNRELGLTIVLVTHEMDVIRRTCDQVTVLDQGKVVETGVVSDLFLFPRHPVTRALLEEHDSTAPAPAPLDDTTGTKVRLTLTDPAAQSPELSRILRLTGTDFQLLEGGILTLRSQRHARLTLGLTGAGTEQALQRLAAAGMTVERLST